MNQLLWPVSREIPAHGNSVNIEMHPLATPTKEKFQLFLTQGCLSFEEKAAEIEDIEPAPPDAEAMDLVVRYSKVDPDESLLYCMMRNIQYTPSTFVQKLNKGVVVDNAKGLFILRPLIIDWVDEDWNLGVIPNFEGLIRHLGQYSELAEDMHPTELPPFANPYVVPQDEAVLSRIRLRLLVSPGMQAIFSSRIFMARLGFDPAQFTSTQGSTNIILAGGDITQWAMITANRPPEKEIAFSKDFSVILSTTQDTLEYKVPFAMSYHAKRNQGELLLNVKESVKKVREESNMNLGVHIVRHVFAFDLPLDGLINTYIYLPQTLAEAMGAPHLKVDKNTVFLSMKGESWGDVVAGDAHRADNLGNIIACIPELPSAGFPGRPLAIFAPQDNVFNMFQSPLQCEPFMLNQKDFQFIYPQTITLCMYTHDAQGNFQALDVPRNMRFQGMMCIQKV